MQTPLRVALMTTADSTQPGSMAAYATLVQQALALYPDRVKAEVVNLLEGVPQWAQVPPRLRQRLTQAWLLTRASQRLRPVKADIYHLLDGSFAYALSGFHPPALVVTVHDLIPVLQDEGHFPVAAPGRLAHWLLTQNLAVLRRQQYFFAVSTCTAQDLRPRVNAQARIDVLPLALRSSLLAHLPSSVKPWDNRLIEGERYILHIGNNGFYKNRLTVAQVCGELAQTCPVKLVLAGAPPDAALHHQLGDLIHQKKVLFIPYPDDQTLANLYQQASVLLFPSYYEGFGWPPLEAMAFGCPVVCSNAGSLPEVVGQAALMAAPEDWQGLAHQCRQILDNPNLAARQIDLGFRNLDRFTLAEMAQKLVSLYQAMAASQQSVLDDKSPC
jgi:glycosyltransferase involved in cell wall biosynthesis